MVYEIGLASGTSRSEGSHVSPSVVIETFNLPDRGDGVPPEISQVRQHVDWIGLEHDFAFRAGRIISLWEFLNYLYFLLNRLFRLFLALLDFQMLEVVVVGLISGQVIISIPSN